MKEDQSEFSEERRLGIWWFLSEFIGFLTEFHVEKSKEREVTDSEDVDEEKLWRKVRRVMSPVSSRRTSPNLGGITLEGSGLGALRIHRLPHRVAR